MTVFQVLALALLSGLASLDRLAGMNIMLSRPFVVSGIIGCIFGNLGMCLFIGVLFELLGMLEVPVGTTVSNDDTFGGYATSLLVATGVVSHDAVSLLFCICVAVAMIYPVTLSDKYCRSFNRWLIVQSVKNHKSDFESRLISYGLVVSFLRGLIVYNSAVVIIWYILHFVDNIHNTTYSPYLSFIFLMAFMGGYLVRFFFVKNFLKISLLTAGIAFGWFVL